jgi:hypothetical protein
MMKFHDPFQLSYMGLHDSAPRPEPAILSGILMHFTRIRHISLVRMNRTGQVDLFSGRLNPMDDPYIGIKARWYSPARRTDYQEEVLP